MSSFFSKLRQSKLGKKKPAQDANTPQNTLYSSSNNSSQMSLGQKSYVAPQANQQRAFTQFQQPAQTPQVSFANRVQDHGSGAQAAQQQLTQHQHQHQHQYQNQISPSSQPQPLFLRQPFVHSALVKGSFQTIVEVPRYVDQYEWIALNIFEFNSNIKQFVTLLSDYIDHSHTMSAGPGYDYLWIDTNKQTVRLPAAVYIEFTFSWISTKLDDPALFPTRPGVPFPPNFPALVKSIYSQLFRIFAYIYHNQFDKIVHLSLEPHLNSLFCHFTSFGKTFDLIDKNESVPLQQLIQSMELQGKIV